MIDYTSCTWCCIVIKRGLIMTTKIPWNMLGMKLVNTYYETVTQTECNMFYGEEQLFYFWLIKLFTFSLINL